MQSLRRNFLWSLVGYMFYGVSQWFVLILLAKMCDTEAVGQFALGLAIAAPVLFLANFNLKGVQATDAEGEYYFSEYMVLRLLTTPVALSAMAGYTWFMGYESRTLSAVFLVGIAKSVESVTDISYGLFQGRERMDMVCVSIVLKGVCSVSCMWGFLLLKRDLLVGLVGLNLAWIVVSAAYDIPQSVRLVSPDKGIKALISPVRPSMVFRLARSAFPLGITGFLGSLQTTVPRVMIERSLSAKDVGVFAALSYFLTAGSRFVLALNQSTSPRQARYFASGDLRAFRGILTKLVMIDVGLGVLATAVAFLVGSPLLHAVYGPEYAEHAGTFVVLMASGGLMYISASLEHSCTAVRLFGVQARILLAALVTMIGACFLLVPRLGIRGAAFATMIAAAVQLTGYVLALRAGLRRPSRPQTSVSAP